MAVALDPKRLALFEDLFRNPSCVRMHDELSPDDFEVFVDYVFTCAGYAVEDVSERRFPRGPGVDLNL